MQVIEEGDGSYPSEEDEEEEEVRVPTDITAEGVELIASYWYGSLSNIYTRKRHTVDERDN